MAKLIPHTNKEVIKKLKKNRFVIKESRKGKNRKHFFFWKRYPDGTEGIALVSKNPSDPTPTGTLQNIIRTSKKPKKEFCSK